LHHDNLPSDTFFSTVEFYTKISPYFSLSPIGGKTEALHFDTMR
jgi:hypothetical protein